MRNLLLAATGLGFAALAPAANATLVEASTDGGATFTPICSAAAGTACVGSATVGGIAFTLTGMNTNSPGTPALADILSAAVTIQDNNAAGSTTSGIVLRAIDTGFLNPHTPPSLTLASEIGGSVLIGGTANTMAFISCVVPGAASSCAGGTSTAPVSPNIKLVTTAYSGNDSVGVTLLSAPFTMIEQTTYTLSGGTELNFSASSDLTPVPEPASLALLGVGLLGVGFVANRKRSV